MQDLSRVRQDPPPHPRYMPNNNSNIVREAYMLRFAHIVDFTFRQQTEVSCDAKRIVALVVTRVNNLIHSIYLFSD